MEKLSRRRFMGLSAALGAVAAVGVPSFATATPKVNRAISGGKIREMAMLALSMRAGEDDAWVVRHDIFIDGNQYGVDSRCWVGEAAKHGWTCYEDWLDTARPIAREVLQDVLTQRGRTFENCQLLPFVEGFPHMGYV